MSKKLRAALIPGDPRALIFTGKSMVSSRALGIDFKFYKYQLFETLSRFIFVALTGHWKTFQAYFQLVLFDKSALWRWI